MSPTAIKTAALCLCILAEPLLPGWAMIVLMAVAGTIAIALSRWMDRRAQRRIARDAITATLREVNPDRCQQQRGRSDR